jgi:hypothetical protein
MQPLRTLGKAIALTVSAGLFFTCTENLLVEDPSNILAPTNFYQDLNQAEIALAGVYAGQQRLQGYVGGDAGVAQLWGTHGTDEIVVPPWSPAGRRSIALYALNPNIDVFLTMYSRHYEEVNRANTMIDRVAAMSEDQIDDEDRAGILAQALVIRANYYFNLVRIWNRVPLVTEERTNLDDLTFTQAEPEAVYAFIVDELLAAVPDLEVGKRTGRITRGAAQALLGKVYLQMAGWPLRQTQHYADAAGQFAAVMGMNYALLPDFQQVFDYQNELNDEMVYVIEHDGPSQSIDGTQNSNLGSFMGPHGNLDEGAGWGTAWAPAKLELAYDREDTRRRVTIAYHNAPVLDSVRALDQIKPWKWQKPNPNTWRNDTPFDYPYIRYAEVLLGFAEADARANDAVTAPALAAINQVRARARGMASAATTVPPYGPDISLPDFIEAVLRERYLELAFEGHRKGDLVRTERLIQVMRDFDASDSAVWPGAPEIEDHEWVWPIPQGVLDLNPNYQQNNGY